jgi:hypothetical protein
MARSLSRLARILAHREALYAVLIVCAVLAAI